MEKQTYYTAWRGIELELHYTPVYWDKTAHLEVRAIRPERAPLPITGTGYRSHFHPRSQIQQNEGETQEDAVVRSVLEWLETEAANSNWAAREAELRQLELF